MSWAPERRSLLDGASNFRDLGGYATVDEGVVRTGMVFRSGSLHALTDADHQRLRSLGVRVAVDLRPPEEVAAEPTVLDDYELTSGYAATARVEELASRLSGSGLPPAVIAGLLGTSRSALADAIAALRDKHGTINDYLLGPAGLGEADLTVLRRRLTAPSP